MNTVSFVVRFINPKTEQEEQVRHELVVYESIHAPAFKGLARRKITEFIEAEYNRGYGYTHFCDKFASPLGVDVMNLNQRKGKKENVSTL